MDAYLVKSECIHVVIPLTLTYQVILFSRNLHMKVVPDVGMKLGLVDDVLENNVMSGGTATCSDSELYSI